MNMLGASFLLAGARGVVGSSPYQQQCPAVGIKLPGWTGTGKAYGGSLQMGVVKQQGIATIQATSSAVASQ